MSLLRLFKKTIEQSAHLYIGDSLIHGRGVFSNKKLATDELIERAPLVLIREGEHELLKQTVLYHYYFLVQDKQTPVAIGLGYSSLYNHACPANARYYIDLDRKLIEIRANHIITISEEITINYNGEPKDTTVVSFPDHTL